MKTVDCSNMVIKDIIEILKEFPMCDLCVKDDKSIVILDHTGYGIKELVLED